MNVIKYSLLLLLISLFFCGCKNDEIENNDEANDETENNDETSAQTEKVTNFIHDNMSAWYLWNTRIPNLNLKQEKDPLKYFSKILVPEDLYSYATNDLEGLSNSNKGIEKTFGYSLASTSVNKENTIFVAIVVCVYPNTPAAKQNIKRGDFITKLNGKSMGKEELNKLFASNSLNITVASKLENSQFTGTREISMNAVTMAMNPVHTHKIIDVNGVKTGYLYYTQFLSEYNFSLNNVFQEFKNENVQELILDLSNNPGGDEIAIINLCSHIAPIPTLNAKSTIIKTYYNQPLTQYMQKENINNKICFIDSLVDQNLNLKRVFILSDYTYSAAEVTIVGLMPYMDVILIGGKTGGKNKGMTLLTSDDPELKNWGLMPVISEYKNSKDFSPVGGLTPDYPVEEDYTALLELGDERSPLVAKAISIIKNTATPANFSIINKEPQLKVIEYRSSKFEKLKQNLIHNKVK